MSNKANATKIELKCPGGRAVSCVCVSNKCDHIAFCCKEQNCCQKILKPKCEIIKIEDLIKTTELNCSRFDRVYNSTLEFFENMIKMVDNEIKVFKELSDNFFSMRKILGGLDSQNKTAEEVSQILENNKEYNEEYFSEIEAYLKVWDKNLREHFSQIRSVLCDKSQKKPGEESWVASKKYNDQTIKNFSLSSTIVWKENEKETLFDVLNHLKNVRSVNLLFHATSHEFSVSKFHELCDGIPNTLVIIKNDQDKTYGGFTPMPWGKSKFEKFIPDNTLKSMVFSLSHNWKFYLCETHKNYAIEWNSLFGPIFGRCNIIQVWDKANKESTYWEQTPFSFKPSHGEWTEDMYEEMLGVKRYTNFKLIDWEVFEVIFN